MSWFNSRPRLIGSALLFASAMGGCSDIYYDRRETVAFGAKEAVAANQAVQTIDPWPPASADRRLAANGEVVAAGIERYRTGRVIPPKGTGTSGTYQPQQQSQQPGSANNSAGTIARP